MAKCELCGKEFEPEYGMYRNYCPDCKDKLWDYGCEYQEYLDDLAHENDIKIRINTTNAYIQEKLNEKGISYMSKAEFINSRK